MFFTHLKELVRAINAVFRPVNMGGAKSNRFQELVKPLMQILVSLTVLITGCWLMLSGRDAESQKIGYALVGIVTGYWLG